MIMKQMGMVDMDVMYIDDLVDAIKGDDLSESGISEIYSVPRVGARAPGHGLTQGWALDLMTGWVFGAHDVRKRAKALLDRTRPKLLVGSPMCTYFDSLHYSLCFSPLCCVLFLHCAGIHIHSESRV